MVDLKALCHPQPSIKCLLDSNSPTPCPCRLLLLLVLEDLKPGSRRGKDLQSRLHQDSKDMGSGSDDNRGILKTSERDLKHRREMPRRSTITDQVRVRGRRGLAALMSLSDISNGSSWTPGSVVNIDTGRHGKKRHQSMTELVRARTDDNIHFDNTRPADPGRQPETASRRSHNRGGNGEGQLSKAKL